MRDTLLKTELINVAKTNTMLFLQNYPRHNFNEKEFEEYLKQNSWNGFFISALLTWASTEEYLHGMN